MALFGEKYGERVRMIEIEGVSRELCGGTHVSSTSEIGLFHVTTETSSASNVRRIEAVTGPEAARLFQERTQRLNEIAARLKVPENEVVHAVERLSERVKELEKQAEGRRTAASTSTTLSTAPSEKDGVLILVEARSRAWTRTRCVTLSDTVRQKLGRRRGRARLRGRRTCAPCSQRVTRRWWSAGSRRATSCARRRR